MNKGILRNVLHDGISDTEALPHIVAIHGYSGNGGRVHAANVPKQYRNELISDTKVRESEPKIYMAIDRYVKTFVRQWETFEKSDQIMGLYLYSPNTGNGKTTTASAILNEFILRHYVGSLKRGLRPLHQPAYFFDANEWHTLYTQFARSNVPRHVAEPAAEEYYRRAKIAKEVPFLVMDDIGVREDVTEAFRMDLHALINHRNVEELPTVYTSNVPLKDLATLYKDPRLPDRIRDMTRELTFTGTSKRGKRK
ncbi:DNA replication protein [Bacillus sp. FSL M8-0063]|uniref:DNA replication protein n=1 Tax=Bacillus sp. FSL M8-0063 TaxID=2921566 RepID=UPI0030F9EF0B